MKTGLTILQLDTLEAIARSDITRSHTDVNGGAYARLTSRGRELLETAETPR